VFIVFFVALFVCLLLCLLLFAVFVVVDHFLSPCCCCVVLVLCWRCFLLASMLPVLLETF